MRFLTSILPFLSLTAGVIVTLYVGKAAWLFVGLAALFTWISTRLRGKQGRGKTVEIPKP